MCVQAYKSPQVFCVSSLLCLPLLYFSSLLSPLHLVCIFSMSTTVTITSTENDSVSESIVPPEHVSVLEQLRDFRQKIPRELLAKYERPTTTLAVWYVHVCICIPRPLTHSICSQIFGDWLAAIIGWQTYVWRPNAWTFTFALLLMAWSQRGISNLAHDCNHYNLFKRRVRHLNWPGITPKLTILQTDSQRRCRRLIFSTCPHEHRAFATQGTHGSPPLPGHKGRPRSRPSQRDKPQAL